MGQIFDPAWEYFLSWLTFHLFFLFLVEMAREEAYGNSGYSSLGLIRHRNYTHTHYEDVVSTLFTADDTVALSVWKCAPVRFTVMKKMRTVQPDVSVFIWRVPPVPGVARQMAWWLQKQVLARLQSHAWESCLVLCPWCLRVISHSCHLYWQPKFAGQAF